MPLISQNCLNHIRQQVALADVVAPYVQLKPCGRYLKGLSPFSNEKTPSFFVDPQRNTFKCFSSGHAGDLFRFLELKEQLTFSEAVEWICEKFSIPIEYASSSAESSQPSTVSIKKQLFEVYARATQFFMEQFWAHTPHALQAQQYWEQTRHFQLETARTFQVGWAPTDGTLLYQALRQQHFSHEHPSTKIRIWPGDAAQRRPRRRLRPDTALRDRRPDTRRGASRLPSPERWDRR